MYSLKKIHKEFTTEIGQLEIILDNLSTKSDDYERNIFIHGTFLRVIIVWERFLESLFTSALCGAKSLSGSEIKPKISRLANKEKAYDFLRIEGKRKAPYLDWLESDAIKARVKQCFHHSSRLHKLYEGSATYNQILAIRNHIAHDSQSSLKKLHDSVIRQAGYLATSSTLSPSPAQILISTNRASGNRFYKVYIEHYTNLAVLMVQ
jgi:hypothetical protein